MMQHSVSNALQMSQSATSASEGTPHSSVGTGPEKLFPLAVKYAGEEKEGKKALWISICRLQDLTNIQHMMK